MLTDTVTFSALIIAEIICIVLSIIIKNKIKESQLRKAFQFLTSMMLISCTGVILQNLLSKPLNINPIYFEYIIYIGNVFLPVSFLLVGVIYANTKIEIKRIHILLLAMPILSLLVLWTNDYHYLFFKEYAVNFIDTEYGAYASIYSIYTIILFIIAFKYLIGYSIKNAGFFSKQAILIIISVIPPIVVNVISTLKIINATIYITPISFTITILILAFAIFKFKLLSATPIALQRIVDRISDSYLILDEDNTITDFNETFVKTFQEKKENIRNANVINYLKKYKVSIKKIENALKKVKNSDETVIFQQKVDKINKIFSVEINRISKNGNFLGTLVLLKDITQHIIDIETIKNNQDILMERERLASLGQLIGGIAHNLKTPIMSVAGAIEGLTDLINEYDTSIEDPEVNFGDHHDIANDMREWIKKIKSYIEYMSDIITAVKGQAVAMSEQEAVEFTVEELVKRVNILMKHELKKAIIYLNVEMNVNPNLSLKGEINGLVQVINNIISNAIQAYNGEPEKNIDMIVNKDKDNLIISIRDYAGGLPEKVKEKLFKEMITTKGKNGTGLGMYMSYSNIRAYFGGTITYDSIDGEGTTFNVILPINK